MSGSSSDSEEENYWPGFVDALTTMTMVLTFIMMVLGIVVFSLSQTVQRAQLEAIADAAEVKTPQKQSISELKDAIIARIATLAKAGPPLKDIPRDPTKGIMDTSAEKPTVLPESTAVPQPVADSIPADKQIGGPAQVALVDPAPVPFARPTFGGVPTPLTTPKGERVTSDQPETNAPEVAVPPVRQDTPPPPVAAAPIKEPEAPPVKQAETTPEETPRPPETPPRPAEAKPAPAEPPPVTIASATPVEAPAPIAPPAPAAPEPAPTPVVAAPPEPPPPVVVARVEPTPAPPPPVASPPVVAPPVTPPAQPVPQALVSTVPDPEIIESKAPPTLGKRRTGATVSSTGAFIIVKFVPQSTMLAPEEQSQVRRALRDEGTSTARTIEILALSGLGSPDITEERQRAYFRMMMLRNELIASGIQSSKIRMLVRDSTNPDDFNVVRITARS